MTGTNFISRTASPARTAASQSLLPPLAQCALLLDIDGTLLDLAPAPDEVQVPQSLRQSLQALFEHASGALAFVSGRSICDIDHIFSPLVFPAIGGHGAEMRVSSTSEACALSSRPMNPELKKRFAELAELSGAILIEDKDYSLAIHYRKAPELERAIFSGVAAIRADLPDAAIDVLPGKRVVEIKPSGFSKASGVRELLTHMPFKGRCPVFVGDDVTDDSVFAIMPDLAGLSFSVGRKARGVSGQFDRPRDVRRWLAELAASRSAPR
jgi:trehalose 6-phosphate phosphatase